MATKGKPKSGAGAGGYSIPPPPTGGAATGSGQSLSGSSSVNLGASVWVPSVPGSLIGMKQTTIQSYINGLSPQNLMSWEPMLIATGYATTIDPASLRVALANALYDASQSPDPNHAGSKGTNITDYLNNLYTAQQNAAPAGPARAYRGGTTSVSVTPAATVQVVGDAVAQSLLGRHITNDEVQNITSSLNQQEYAKGSADIATAQSQQEAMNVAYGGGVNAANAASQAAGKPYSGTIGTPQDFAQAVLTDAGLPITQQNITNMLIWMQNENPVSNWAPRNNPLNASLGTSAADGTAGYKDLATAASYTAQMIKQRNMSPIYSALQKGGASQAEFGKSVITSPWASSHYGGDVSRFTGTPAALSGQVAPLASGQQTATETIGQTTAVKRGNETYYQLPPTATVYQTPETTDQAAASYMMNNEAPQYQEHNLVNVFSTIQKMLGGNTSGPLQEAVKLP